MRALTDHTQHQPLQPYELKSVLATPRSPDKGEPPTLYHTLYTTVVERTTQLRRFLRIIPSYATSEEGTTCDLRHIGVTLVT